MLWKGNWFPAPPPPPPLYTEICRTSNHFCLVEFSATKPVFVCACLIWTIISKSCKCEVYSFKSSCNKICSFTYLSSLFSCLSALVKWRVVSFIYLEIGPVNLFFSPFNLLFLYGVVVHIMSLWLTNIKGITHIIVCEHS